MDSLYDLLETPTPFHHLQVAVLPLALKYICVGSVSVGGCISPHMYYHPLQEHADRLFKLHWVLIQHLSTTTGNPENQLNTMNQVIVLKERDQSSKAL